MNVSSCPHCGVNVIPREDRSCPSCGESFDESPDPQHVTLEAAADDGQTDALSAGDQQARVDDLTRFGIVLSIVWLMGIGSTCSFFAGLRALKIIEQSQYRLYGKLRAWWCVVVGGSGMLALLYFLVAFILHWAGFEGYWFNIR